MYEKIKVFLCLQQFFPTEICRNILKKTFPPLEIVVFHYSWKRALTDPEYRNFLMLRRIQIQNQGLLFDP